VPPRKKIAKLKPETKKYIFLVLFVFLWIMSLLADKNNGWIIGIYMQSYLFKVFWAYYKWIFWPVLLLISIFLLKNRSNQFDFYKLLWLVFYLSSFTTLIGLFSNLFGSEYFALFNLYPSTEIYLGPIGNFIIFTVLFILSLIILFSFSPIAFTQNILSIWKNISWNIKKDSSKLKSEISQTRKNAKENKKQKELENMMQQLKEEKRALAKSKQPNQLNIKDAPRKIQIEKKIPDSIWNLFKKEKKIEINQWESEDSKQTTQTNFKNWKLPNISLLEKRSWNIKKDENEIRRKEIEIQEKLLQFKIEVDMEWYQVWPTVIQYRLKPKSWVKLQKIVNLKQDLTLALHAKNIRIQAPIPGLWVVWVEVPNDNRQPVWLKEVIESREFNSRKHEIPIALWKDVSGNVVVWDLTKMPHLLVAWQTGSGKSVWINGFILSILYKFSPSELKLIMIDPKKVELSIYNGIPHLLTPVISNPDKALNSLKWCVAEMLRRYDLATKAKARNLKEFNAKVSKAEKLPYIVMVIDELADLMMSGNKKEVEGSIARVAQMARAVWIHLIIATQRPSVDVITWLIKANIPSRIAFTVASQIDSRTVLDKMWAEDLLWRWDMLYYPTGNMWPERVQWVLVEVNEVEAVVNQIKLTVDPDVLKNLQIDEIVNWKSKLEGSILENYKWEQDEDPEVIEKAIQVVKESKKGSTSLIQRKLWLGYARAAKVLDILEELWVVGPSNGSKPREVYVD